MPINVKDFVIKSKVIQRAENEGSSGSSGGGCGSYITPSEKEELIHECMEKVIAYLERKQKHY